MMAHIPTLTLESKNGLVSRVLLDGQEVKSCKKLTITIDGHKLPHLEMSCDLLDLNIPSLPVDVTAQERVLDFAPVFNLIREAAPWYRRKGLRNKVRQLVGGGNP